MCGAPSKAAGGPRASQGWRWVSRCISRLAGPLVRSSFRTWMKARSGCAELLLPAPDRRRESALQIRRACCFAPFRKVTQCTSQVGRPDDGTDTTGFFNTEYFADPEAEGTM